MATGSLQTKAEARNLYSDEEPLASAAYFAETSTSIISAPVAPLHHICH